MYLYLDSLHTSHLDFHSQLFIKFFSSVIPSHPGVLIMFLFRVKKCSLPKCTCYTLSKSNIMYGTVTFFLDNSISDF